MPFSLGAAVLLAVLLQLDRAMNAIIPNQVILSTANESTNTILHRGRLVRHSWEGGRQQPLVMRLVSLNLRICILAVRKVTLIVTGTALGP